MNDLLEPLEPTEYLLVSITEPRHTQRDVAADYGLMLTAEVDWSVVNRAIIERWSPAGLKTVKELAWKLRSGPRAECAEITQEMQEAE